MGTPRLLCCHRSFLLMLMSGAVVSAAAAARLAQDLGEQCPRHGDLGQLEDEVAAVAHGPGADLDQLLAQGHQRPMLDLPRQSQRAQEVGEVVGQREQLELRSGVVSGAAKQPQRADSVSNLQIPALKAADRKTCCCKHLLFRSVSWKHSDRLGSRRPGGLGDRPTDQEEYSDRNRRETEPRGSRQPRWSCRCAIEPHPVGCHRLGDVLDPLLAHRLEAEGKLLFAIFAAILCPPRRGSSQGIAAGTLKAVSSPALTPLRGGAFVQPPLSAATYFNRVYPGGAARGSDIPVIVSNTEGIVVDRIDQRIWYVVAAVVVLLLLAWLLGWFGGAEVPPPATTQ